MIADMLTKGICKIQFAKLRSMSEEECWKLGTLARLLRNILEELCENKVV